MKVKCNNENCTNETGFEQGELSDDTDIYCCEECRYNSETGRPGEEY